MKFEKPVFEAKFVKRYKRFFADVEIDGELVTAHCANTGSMKSCLKDGMDCLVSFHDDPKRKLQYSLELTKPGKAWVCVNTGRPNKMVEELFLNNPLEHWKAYDRVATEVKIHDKTRIDLVLWNSKDFSGKKPKVEDIEKYKCFHFIEVKNVTLKEGELALFPDSVSTRGQKHLQELMDLQNAGQSCEILFTINRGDVASFSPAKDIDPEYAKLLKATKAAGVKISPLLSKITKKEVSLTGESIKLIL
tara:strand:+ start:149 stop:892 length:744 start_codon:yes stop_codon:yes gene_type:complete